MSVPGYRDTPGQQWDPHLPVDLREAEDFLGQYYREHPQRGDGRERLAQIRDEVAETGTYVHTYPELVFGCRVAWRNASRCIGRLYWRSLVVRDLRKVSAPDEIFEELVRHLHLAGQRERNVIRPVISVFAQHVPGREGARLWNEQLIRYAGHRHTEGPHAGTVVGDPRYTQFTETLQQYGWRGKPDNPFDVLPLAIEGPGGDVNLYDLPETAVWEVPIEHPTLRWFAELGLRWHAVPAIANMRLTIGGVDYPLAPFNGWYLGTEIGARNLADTDRYNLLPVIAERMGLDTSTERSLWRDTALLELNRAVLWSFDQAGARISDHHSESERFLAHVASEERAGRPTPADWTWIVPPMSGATTGVFHRYYHEADQRPAFYLDSDARELGRRGRSPVVPRVPDEPASCPFHEPAPAALSRRRGWLGRLLQRD
ncbi:nitric oxide synthase oxygenase [Dactylosporangium aurantiacum]|uniref:Nitric oxide synthase oxygenase n=1 Tax=Dactylosporangium aurantiacum TaxID=35754 RepID=A0A9Q9IBK0_9ACTN|nr:nitric oxide synthase oxygenase [Dactylosporangium aurantiacum]MDG6102278.1 nitric oxide synthase oxygenase [Dactylosporangium aurantiacum]UWZ53414.1 nitric oxide synthase oxygenase [Dactylosporangium aurantiacum]